MRDVREFMLETIKDVSGATADEMLLVTKNPDEPLDILLRFDSLDAIEVEMEFETVYEDYIGHLEEEYIFKRMSFNEIMTAATDLVGNE